jgi:hypothetical protein
MDFSWAFIGVVGIGLAMGIGCIYAGFRMAQWHFDQLGEAYSNGAHSQEQLYRKVNAMVNPVSPDAMREAIADLKAPCDIVFVTEILTHLGSGVYAGSWRQVIGDVYNAVTNFLKEQPPEVNTVVVRSIRVKGPENVEFVLEGFYNPHFKAPGVAEEGD